MKHITVFIALILIMGCDGGSSGSSSSYSSSSSSSSCVSNSESRFRSCINNIPGTASEADMNYCLNLHEARKRSC